MRSFVLNCSIVTAAYSVVLVNSTLSSLKGLDACAKLCALISWLVHTDFASLDFSAFGAQQPTPYRTFFDEFIRWTNSIAFAVSVTL